MTATISKTDLINKIVDALYEFGLDEIKDESTTVFVNKSDYSDVEIADSEFDTFTKAYATMARFFVDFNGDNNKIDRRQIREWVESFDTELE